MKRSSLQTVLSLACTARQRPEELRLEAGLPDKSSFTFRFRPDAELAFKGQATDIKGSGKAMER